MQQSFDTAHSPRRPDHKVEILDALVSFVVKRNDWSIPLGDSHYWEQSIPAISNQRVRAILQQLAEEGRVIKVIARTLPDSLRLRLPSWIDCKQSLLFEPPERHERPEILSRCASFGHFIPSPAYLATLPPARFESSLHASWLMGESERVWRELQRDEVRALIATTNVPKEVTLVLEALATTLLGQVRMYPHINRVEVRRALSSVAHRVGFSPPVSKEDETELLRLARELLLKGRDEHVRSHFESLT